VLKDDKVITAAKYRSRRLIEKSAAANRPFAGAQCAKKSGIAEVFASADLRRGLTREYIDMDAFLFGGGDEACEERNAVLRDSWLNDRHAITSAHKPDLS
jgi:hypothetical protein